MIEIENMSFTYTSGGRAVPALSSVSLSVARGEFVSIVGPSGCGKSTLIKIIGDLLEPSAGNVRVDGLSSQEARLKGMFSFVFQNPVLLPWRRIIDNVLLPLEVLKRKGRDPQAMLNLVGLDGFGDRYPWELSGGMRQRAMLARALIHDPPILLMDEPFASVDEITRQTLNRELMRIWHELRVTIVFITHSLSEAVLLSDRVLVMSKRPAHVRKVVDIRLPRPRTESSLLTADFQELVQCLKAELE
jgi:NitT/TauT family transport system ATP-binding protein